VECFGPETTARFLALNGLKLLIRSHQVADEGYEVLHNGQCVTVFSASNYCGTTGNLGGW
jgi:serine/threonine-protein phosphatase 5